MGTSYEQAVTALYRAPLESFVTERRRLAGELKATGDKSGAAQLAKLARPPISAWVVNQLWWHAREAFDELFETAAQLRNGKLAAGTAHRKAITKLAAHAQQLLTEAGHSANEATLRRVTMTLSSLAATGSFAPDEPGTLSSDRAPPGFEAFGIVGSRAEDIEKEPAHQREADGGEHKKHAAAEHQRHAEAAEHKRQADAAEHQRRLEAQAKREAQRKKLADELRATKAELAEREHERDRLAKQLATAEREVDRARAAVEAAELQLKSAPA